MSASLLKIIALISMIVDHITVFIEDSSVIYLDYTFIEYGRAIGRVALPIFAYFIVVGFEKTKNLRKYITRIHLIAIVSQIPFILAFYYFEISPNNLYPLENTIYFEVFVMILTYYYIVRAQQFEFSDLIVIGAYILIPLFVYCVPESSLNIFYEFGASLIILVLLRDIKLAFDFRNYVRLLILALLVYINFSFMIKYVNYGDSAILLIGYLYVLRREKLISSIVIFVWGYIKYSFSMPAVVFVLIAAILLYFYNGKKGKDLKYLFYIAYPLHILLIAIYNIFWL